MFFDTHCHLDMLKKISPQEAVDLAKEQQVNHLVTIAVRPENQDDVISIAKKFDHVYCTQGIHPHDAQHFDENCKKKILENIKSAKENKVVAYGEIGLDFHYNYSEPEKQKEVFEEQLQIGIDHDLPIVIHTRDADDDTLAILKNFEGHFKKPAILHSYTSGKDLAQYALTQNFYLGFNGIITFKKADEVRAVLEMTPVEQLLFETDAPFLSPAPNRGKENHSANIPFIAEKVAQLKGVDDNEEKKQQLFSTVYQNSLSFYDLQA